jgi:hypothetical protein
MSLGRIPSMKDYRYDLEEPARRLAIHCVDVLRKDKSPEREHNANAVLHTAVLAEMCAFKDQLDEMVKVALQWGLDKVKQRQ